jgi:hypothetical protein
MWRHNINYLNESSWKKVNSLLGHKSLTVNFATRVQNFPSAAIDNIVVDSAIVSSSYISYSKYY